MRFWRGSEPRASKREVAAIALQEKGFKVDGKANVREGDLVIGSLDPDGNFTYPVSNEYLPTMDIVRAVIFGLGRVAVNYQDWKPNA